MCTWFINSAESEWGEWKTWRLSFCGVYAETRPALDEEPQRGLSLSLALSFTVIPVPPSPHSITHKGTSMHRTQPSIHRHTHAAVYGQRGYRSLPSKASAAADTSHSRQLGHNLRLNVCLVCPCICTFSAL